MMRLTYILFRGSINDIKCQWSIHDQIPKHFYPNNKTRNVLQNKKNVFLNISDNWERCVLNSSEPIHDKKLAKFLSVLHCAKNQMFNTLINSFKNKDANKTALTHK